MTKKRVAHSFQHQFLLYQPKPAKRETSDPVKDMLAELRDRSVSFDSRLQRLEVLLERLLGATQISGKTANRSEEGRR